MRLPPLARRGQRQAQAGAGASSRKWGTEPTGPSMPVRGSCHTVLPHGNCLSKSIKHQFVPCSVQTAKIPAQGEPVESAEGTACPELRAPQTPRTPVTPPREEARTPCRPHAAQAGLRTCSRSLKGCPMLPAVTCVRGGHPTSHLCQGERGALHLNPTTTVRWGQHLLPMTRLPEFQGAGVRTAALPGDGAAARGSLTSPDYMQ